jgi:MoxR-like ATPase
MSENPPPDELQARLQEFRTCFEQLKTEVQKAVIGQEDIIEKTVIAMIAGGHVLLEGVPGLGKTLLVRSLAGALHLSFQRVQFTPDLMPADLIGTKILVDDGHGHSRFEFAPGPVFCNLLLGDEINRATPKTQSALLEAMQEQSVTVGGETRQLKKPFFVLATQNPLEMEGTYPLPEAQLDRFFFKITVNYPNADAFERILDVTTARDLPTVQPVFDGARLVEMGALARDVPVAPTIRQRVVHLIMATHPETEHAIDGVKRYVRYGASPRAGQACLLAAKIRAILQGRFHVAGEDILAVALPVLRHRVMMSFEAQADGVSADSLLNQIFEAEKKTWN